MPYVPVVFLGFKPNVSGVVTARVRPFCCPCKPRVPTQTGKMDKLFPFREVREFCADWKSQGNLDKILEKSGKFREFLFFVLFLIELYLLKWIKFSVFRPTWWVFSVVIQFGESWCPTACICSPSTDSILGLLLTSYTIWFGWP